MVDSGKVEGGKVIRKTVGSRNMSNDNMGIGNMTILRAGATDPYQQGMNSPEKEEPTWRYKDNLGGFRKRSCLSSLSQ